MKVLRRVVPCNLLDMYQYVPIFLWKVDAAHEYPTHPRRDEQLMCDNITV